MKFIHLSDLHLGKRVNEYSMLEDQKYILDRIMEVIDTEKPDGVIIAGDVYDKAVPTAEAVSLFDDFLVKLAARKLQVFVISGNHDSPERIAFASRLLDVSGIHMSPVYSGATEAISLQDEFGTVDVYMLPFIKPAHVRRFHEDKEIISYSAAVKTAVDDMAVNRENRNILITHQFVTGASRSESEEVSVGGSDNVDASVFEGFDYVALGHIHSPQNCGAANIRYCGTPLKYSFSEAKDKKSLTVVELREKGNLEVRTVELVPLRNMVEIRGTYDELTRKDYYDNTDLRTAYTHITLTDENDIPDAVSKLRIIYTNLMKLSYDNKRTREKREIKTEIEVETKSPLQLFAEFYETQNGQTMSDEQCEFMDALIGKIWGSER